MIESDELRRLCIGVRNEDIRVDEALVSRIEAEIDEHRDRLRDEATQLPPADLIARLPLIGWLIYETSLMLLWDVKTEFDTLPEDRVGVSLVNAALIERLADAARSLPWPEFAPRALGALRAQALVESKRDKPDGYDAAWTLHQEVRNRHESYRDSLGSAPAAGRFRLDLDEVLLQLALAETGTACRTAEQTIGRWIDNFGDADVLTERGEADRWIPRMFGRLSDGADVGERALAIADRIHWEHGFVETITEERLILKTGFRNPAIMTCRALLLMYSLGPAMERLGNRPRGFDIWPDLMASLLTRFHRALAFLVRPAEKADGTPIPLLKDHGRTAVQFCLHLALLTASETLEKPFVVDETLTLHRLDDDAAMAMARWLAEPVGAAVRGDASVVGSASMPHFIRSVEACRDDPGATADYERWREEWTVLDRYGPERWAQIKKLLARDPGGGIW
jgi:hypothetical protein